MVNFKFAKFHCYQEIQSFLITPYFTQCKNAVKKKLKKIVEGSERLLIKKSENNLTFSVSCPIPEYQKSTQNIFCAETFKVY
jgi:hypothetical protein